MARPTPAVMMADITAKATADFLFILVDSEVALDQQYDLIMNGYSTIKKFAGLEDDRTKVRAALALDLTLDPTAVGLPGKEARLALSSLVTAWEAAKERLGKESQLRTEAKASGFTRQVDILERTSMKKAVEALWGPIPQHEAPSSDYLSHKMEELENNDPSASPLDEVNSLTDLDLSATVQGFDAAGRNQLFRKRAKGTLPNNPESFRTRMRVERNVWLYLAAKFTARAWLVGLSPSLFDIYVDYFLGRKVMLLEVVQADGSKHPLSPPWNIVLSYELECRKAAILMVAETQSTLAAALMAVIRDPELKELAFTSPVAHLGRSSQRTTNSTGKGVNRNLQDNPNWPAKKNASPGPYSPSKGKSKGKGKGRKGKGSGKGNQAQAFATPDGRHICFAYNSAAGCSNPQCNRAHVCRNWGCFGAHASVSCPTAAAG
jgi:hypothetical protein